jgi:uncharacterized protein YqeY
MSDLSLKAEISAAMKDAMRAREKQRLGTIRLILAEFKRIEVDERIDIDDARCLVVLDKMLKQRKDSISQFESAGRDDLANIEAFEMTVIQGFLPKALSDDEVETLIVAAMSETGAESVRDMGKVMAILKPKLQGRADVGNVSQLVKKRLSS